jgi:hypothetical protein
MFITLLQFFSAVEEIMNITQADLIPDDVMMLDVYDIIFLWIGNHSNKQERDMAVPMVMEYLRTGDYKIYKYYEHRVFIISLLNYSCFIKGTHTILERIVRDIDRWLWSTIKLLPHQLKRGTDKNHKNKNKLQDTELSSGSCCGL